MKLLITGGLGFIGSNFIRYILQKYPRWHLLNLDARTYSGNPDNLLDVSENSRYRFVKGDIANASLVDGLMSGVDTVVHFAAESHVDRSILDAAPFLRTNMVGTQVLLEAARRHKVRRFIHVSTDEVYGSVLKGRSREGDPLRPNSPYAASKAASDLLVRSYGVTYKLPVVITRSSNNFGPYQYPEKMLPLLITNLMEDKPFPLYGDGRQVRDWIYVLDHVRALDVILHKGRVGETYNIGGSESCANRDLVQRVLRLMGKPKSLIRNVPDRPGHDRRYALDCAKLKRLGWRHSVRFEKALRDTILWYQKNQAWWKKLKERPGYKKYYSKQYASLKVIAPNLIPLPLEGEGGVRGK